MAKTPQWTEGLSATSIGRFGGLNNGFVHRINGFLAMAAGVNDLYVEADLSVSLGRFDPLEPFRPRSRGDWTCLRHDLIGEDEKRLGTVWQSLLSPAVLFESTGRDFTWFNDRSCQILAFYYPTKKGIQRVSSNATFEEAISEPWVLGVAHAHKKTRVVPMLFVFQRRPKRVYNLNSDFHQFQFAGKAGYVAVMPLFGPARMDRDQLRPWRGGLPKDVLAQCRTWAKALLAYPVACEEHFEIDEARGVVRIHNRIRYVEGKNDFGVTPEHLVPVSPSIALAAEKGYGISFDGRLVDMGMKTYLGPYRAARGKELTYTIPLVRQLTQAIAPVRLRNEPKARRLTQRLREELPSPTLTFGGDNTYDVNNIQDVLHDMRVLGWATWSLDEPERRAAADAMLKRLSAFNRSNYRTFTDHYSGRHFVGEKEIWQTTGDVSYDYEWYNGMELAGLWAGMYWLDPDRVARLAERRWDLVEDIARYFELYNDWATSAFWTDLAGEFLWMDGFFFGWQGLCGLHRIARALGKQDVADRTAYLVSKNAVARWVGWSMNDYVQAAMDAGLNLRGAGGPHDQKTPDLDSQHVGGFLEREGFALSPTYAPGNAIGYMVPEMYLFYRDHPHIVERLAKGQDIYLERDIPDWHRKPAFGKPGARWQYPSHWHFYESDDQIFVRSLVLRRPMADLAGLMNEISGPVAEAILVAGAPMVVVPTDARFRGSEYDAKAKELTVRLTAPTDGLTLEVVWPEEPKSVQGARPLSKRSRSGAMVFRLPKGQVEARLTF